ncbi:MAG: hypothetical protein ACFHU9_05985 [Fluviicola sp.]
MAVNSLITKENSLKSFWVVLEFRLSGALFSTKDLNLKGFECEGIFLPPNDEQFQIENLKKNQEIHTKAWLGPSGQERYDATIQFGPQAFQLFEQNLPLEDSIPAYSDTTAWFDLNPSTKTIVIRLL